MVPCLDGVNAISGGAASRDGCGAGNSRRSVGVRQGAGQVKIKIKVKVKVASEEGSGGWSAGG
jgi:hypothetical protein